MEGLSGERSKRPCGKLRGQRKYDISFDCISFNGELFCVNWRQLWESRWRFMFDILKFYLLMRLFKVKVRWHVFVKYFSSYVFLWCDFEKLILVFHYF